MKLNNKEFAKILGMTESQVSKMLSYYVEHFTLDLLMDKIQALDIYTEENSKEILKVS